MNIGLDFDGVIANSHPLKSAVAKRRFGIDIPPERYRRNLVIGQGLTAEQYRQVAEEAICGSYPIPPVANAQIYIPMLQEKHDVRIVTSRTGDKLSFAEELLREYNLLLSVTGVGYGLSKATACRELDVYVDDDPEKLLPLIGVVRNLFFFSWPWNQHEQVPAEIIKVDSWWALYQQIYYDIEVVK